MRDAFGCLQDAPVCTRASSGVLVLIVCFEGRAGRCGALSCWFLGAGPGHGFVRRHLACLKPLLLAWGTQVHAGVFWGRLRFLFWVDRVGTVCEGISCGPVLYWRVPYQARYARGFLGLLSVRFPFFLGGARPCNIDFACVPCSQPGPCCLGAEQVGVPRFRGLALFEGPLV